jgi:AcrR family transcriptional regulator
MKKMAKPRGRPRAYNREMVIERALQAFWRNGFSPTSLGDLVDATGINHPSLYAGFGDKEQIYLIALERFRDMMRARLQQALTSRGEEDTVADAVNRYSCEVVEIYLGNSNEALGCAVFCTALSETTNCEAIREMLAKTLQALNGILEAYLARAYEKGLLDSEFNCVALARLLAATHHSLAVRARAGQSKRELLRVVSAAVGLVR